MPFLTLVISKNIILYFLFPPLVFTEISIFIHITNCPAPSSIKALAISFSLNFIDFIKLHKLNKQNKWKILCEESPDFSTSTVQKYK